MNHPIGILAGLAPVKPNRALANALEPGPPPPSAPLSTRWPLASVVPTGLRRSSRSHHLCSVPSLPSSASPLRHHCLSRSCRLGSPLPVDHGSSWRSRAPGRSDASSSWATSARSHPPPAQCSGDGEARSSKAAAPSWCCSRLDCGNAGRRRGFFKTKAVQQLPSNLRRVLTYSFSLSQSKVPSSHILPNFVSDWIKWLRFWDSNPCFGGIRAIQFSCAYPCLTYFSTPDDF